VSGKYSWVYGVVTVGLILMFWQAAPSWGLLDPLLIPPASAVLARFVVAWGDYTLYRDISATLLRVGSGFIIAVGIGIPLGIAMGHWAQIHRMFTVVIDAVRPIPATAFVPVAVIIFGIGNSMHAFVVFIAAVIPILLASLDGVRSVDPVLIDSACTLGRGRMAIIRSVLLPAALPHIVTGLRIGMAQALIVAVSSEMVLSAEGLGHRVLYAQRLLDISGLYAGVLMLAVVGYVLNRVLVVIENSIVGWDRSARAKQWS
jgi:NitT/TauT family transport system permease protein